MCSYSCAPNIVCCSSSHNCMTVTARPIKKGEQLFYSHIIGSFDHLPTNERKSYIKSVWGFDCKCDRCESTCAPLNQKLMQSDPCYKYVVKNQNNINNSAIVQKRCVEFLNKYGRPGGWSPEIQFVLNVYGPHIGVPTSNIICSTLYKQ